MTPPQLPICLGLILADQIHVCPSTQKKTILGTFSTVFVSEFPASVNFAIYCALTDGMGETEIEIKLVRLKDDFDDESIVAASGMVNFEDSRLVLEMTMFFPEIELSNQGEYRFQVIACNEVILERRLVVIQPENEGETDE